MENNIEFLQRTDQRNLKFHIGFMVKQRLRQREEELEERRRRLRDLLEFENLQHDEELVLLLQARVQESERRRREWIGTMRLERERAEEELLRLKAMQRELENCEEMRHLQSQQLLVETKQAQLCQIEEKKARRRKEQQVEAMWLEALRRLDREKEKHDVFESKLRQVIADATQLRNSQQAVETRTRLQAEARDTLEHHRQDNERAARIDRELKDRERTHERRKLLHQGDVLTQQIAENRQAAQRLRERERELDERAQERIDFDIQMELDAKARRKVQNVEWHKYYLEYAHNERQARRDRDQALADQQSGRECLLLQQKKTPYGRAVR